MNKKIIIVTGPTGVGKTDLVLDFAKQIPSEIINIDVGQFYKPLSIGTAKPILDENNKYEEIPHHLFDILNEPRNLTVQEYRKLVLQKIDEIWSRNKLPILVGGSGFYIQSLIFPPHELEISENLENDFLQEKNNHLWDMLYEIDPERAQAIDKNDQYRIQRALDIWKKTGKKPSEYLPIYQPPCDFTFVVLDREREDLYQRINKRVIQMFDQGWIDEVKKIKKDSQWAEFLKTKKLIGYDEILKYLEMSENGDMDLLIENIQQKTRKYAKRQLTFLRMLTSKILMNYAPGQKIIWCNLTLLDDTNTLFESLKRNL